MELSAAASGMAVQAARAVVRAAASRPLARDRSRATRAGVGASGRTTGVGGPAPLRLPPLAAAAPSWRAARRYGSRRDGTRRAGRGRGVAREVGVAPPRVCAACAGELPGVVRVPGWLPGAVVRERLAVRAVLVRVAAARACAGAPARIAPARENRSPTARATRERPARDPLTRPPTTPTPAAAAIAIAGAARVTPLRRASDALARLAAPSGPPRGAPSAPAAAPTLRPIDIVPVDRRAPQPLARRHHPRRPLRRRR